VDIILIIEIKTSLRGTVFSEFWRDEAGIQGSWSRNAWHRGGGDGADAGTGGHVGGMRGDENDGGGLAAMEREAGMDGRP
jgi:hypothetical protein